MGLFTRLARIASIPLVVLTGCSVQSEDTLPPDVPKRQPLTVPPLDRDQQLPLPHVPEPPRQARVWGDLTAVPVRQTGMWVNLDENAKPRRPTRATSENVNVTTDRISVPPDTHDPRLVEVGVRQWLDARPEYTLPQKIAILHRMRQESSFNPCAENGPMKYLLQWQADRLAQLHRWTRTRPGTCPTWLSQMAFMDHEIKNDSRWATFFGTNNKRAAYKVFTSVYLVGVLGSFP